MQNRRNNLNKTQRNLRNASGYGSVLTLMLLSTAMVFFASPHRGWAQEQDNDAAPTTVDWQAVDLEKILETINEWRAVSKRDPLNWPATELQKQIDLHPNRLAGFLSDALVDSFNSLKPVFQILQAPPQSTRRKKI